MTTSTSDSSTTETEDRLAILELIGRLVLVLDARDWDTLGQLFTDTVYSDRTSLLGGDPVTAGLPCSPCLSDRYQHTTSGRIMPCPASSSQAPPTGSAVPPPVPS